MTFEYNGRTLLEIAQNPLTGDHVERLVSRIDECADDGPEFIASWNPETGVCFTGLAREGELIGWMMFPAKDEASARARATMLGEHAIAALQGFIDPAALAAAAAVARAAGR